MGQAQLDQDPYDLRCADLADKVASAGMTRRVQYALADDADSIISLQAPAEFIAVGHWYADFQQLTDADVDRAMAQRAAAE